MILFSSDFFEAKPGLHPTDREAVGKPLADWLRNRLVTRGARARGFAEPAQVGWTFEVDYDGRKFLIGVHGVRKAGEARLAEYSVLVQVRSTILEILIGGADAAVDDPLILEIEDILADHARVKNAGVLVDG